MDGEFRELMKSTEDLNLIRQDLQGVAERKRGWPMNPHKPKTIVNDTQGEDEDNRK